MQQISFPREAQLQLTVYLKPNSQQPYAHFKHQKVVLITKQNSVVN